MSETNIYLLGSLQIRVTEANANRVQIEFCHQEQVGPDLYSDNVYDYGFTWDADISNGAVIWGEMLDDEVCMHDSVGSDWSISRSEIAEALEAMIAEFDDGDMGIETDSLHHFSGFKACGVMTEILDGLIACDPTRS
jgi:hypothetical protein